VTSTEPYANLLIHIRPWDEAGQCYPVDATLHDGGHFSGGELCLDRARLRAAELDPERYGLALFDALFSGPIRRAYDKATGYAEAQTGGRLRVRLWVDHGAAELHALAWERLHHVRQAIACPVAASAELPFSRYVGLERREPGPVTDWPVRVLFALSNPTDLSDYGLVPLDVEKEVTNLLEPLGDLRQVRGLRVTLMPGRTGLGVRNQVFQKKPGFSVHEGVTSLDNIIRLLTRDAGYHVLHFLGHGRFDRKSGTAALLLEDEGGRVQWARDQDIVAQLQSARPLPHLVFLAACESARRDPEDGNPFVGLAPRLVEAGVPAVVAMQDRVPVATARDLTRDFYRYLLEHGSVDLALNQARLLLFESDNTNWAVPVLFMRLREGRLFDVAGAQDDRVPFMVEGLLAGFVERPGEFGALIDTLLDEGHKEPVATAAKPVAITAALRGAGGYGKTTLAKALCHDGCIRRAFDGGIFWVTLGEKPDVVAGLTQLYAALTGERPGFVNEEDAASALTQAWGDRRCLLVIDDVWNQAHLRPFLRGGPRCTRLITTRNSETLPPGTHKIDVDAMQPGEAVVLLSAGLPASVVGQDGISSRLTELARRLGEWPLLLKLTNGALRERMDRAQTPHEALAWVNKALDRRGLTVFDARDAVARDQAVTRTLSVSLELLSADERARYGELVVFPEDVDIPLVTLQKLWGATGGLDGFDTEELCERLARLSLLLRFDLAARRIRLHDVVRAYLEREQGDRLPVMHGQLLDAYKVTHWDGLPADEPYLWDWLAYHLVGAGRGEELRALLLDFDWLQAKLEASGVAALLADYDFLPDGANLRLVQGAIRLSAHVLAEDGTQLAGQLTGRLLSFDGPDVQALLAQARGWKAFPWLRPLAPSLTPPGGALLRTLTGHTAGVRAVAVTPDGRRAVSASDDQTLKVWDLESGVELRTLTGHTAGVMAVAVTPDGRRAVSASSDQTLKVWDLESGAVIATFSGDGPLDACATAPDGGCSEDTLTIVTGGASGRVHFLRLED